MNNFIKTHVSTKIIVSLESVDELNINRIQLGIRIECNWGLCINKVLRLYRLELHLTKLAFDHIIFLALFFLSCFDDYINEPNNENYT